MIFLKCPSLPAPPPPSLPLLCQGDSLSLQRQNFVFRASNPYGIVCPSRISCHGIARLFFPSPHSSLLSSSRILSNASCLCYCQLQTCLLSPQIPHHLPFISFPFLAEIKQLEAVAVAVGWEPQLTAWTMTGWVTWGNYLTFLSLLFFFFFKSLRIEWNNLDTFQL